MIRIFLILQVLDLATTLFGFRLDLVEKSPFVRLMMGIGPVAGVLFAKIIAFVLLGICIWGRELRVMRWVNYWYSALAGWNIGLIIASARLAGMI